ncbi:MAG: hypothetical protein M3044_06610 [Thermoproteota archaeon]|nr:hypothetical protein [Thermoproteota archaeon]
MTKAKARQEVEMVTDNKTIKVSTRTYDWIAAQSKGYHDTMEIILSRLIAELEESRKKTRK